MVLYGKAADGKSDIRLEFRSTERVEIRDVNARGEATVATTCISMSVVQGGRAVPVEGTQFPATILGRNGLLVREMEGPEQTDPLLIVEAMLVNNPSPPEPVRAGATWRTDLPNNSLRAGGSALSPGSSAQLQYRAAS